MLATFTFAEHARTGRWIRSARSPTSSTSDRPRCGSAVSPCSRRSSCGASCRTTCPEVTARFSRIAAPAIVVVAISGAVQAWRQTDGLDSVFDTTYGRLLLTKIGLVVMIVAAASVSRHIVRLWAERQLSRPARARCGPKPIPRTCANCATRSSSRWRSRSIVLARDRDPREHRTGAGRRRRARAHRRRSTPSQPVQAGRLPARRSRTTVSSSTSSSPPACKGTNQLTVATTKAGAPFDPIEITAKLTDTEQGVTAERADDEGGAGTGTAQGNIDLPFAGTWKLEIRALRTDVDQSVVTDDVEISVGRSEGLAEPVRRGTLGGVTTVPTRYWHALPDGRVQCDVCPRACKLREGQRGLCFVRAREGDGDRAHDLRPVERLLRRPDREEAAQPLPARLGGALVRHRRLQPRVPVLPELGHLEVEGDRHARRRRLAGRPRRDGPASSAAAASRSRTTTRRSSWSTRSTSPTRAAPRASRASRSPPATSARSRAASCTPTSTPRTSTSRRSPRTSTSTSAARTSPTCSTRSSTSCTRPTCGSRSRRC